MISDCIIGIDGGKLRLKRHKAEIDILQLYISSVTEKNCTVMTPSQIIRERILLSFSLHCTSYASEKYKYTASNLGGEATPQARSFIQHFLLP